MDKAKLRELFESISADYAELALWADGRGKDDAALFKSHHEERLKEFDAALSDDD